jgi:hypothetical protein
MNREKPYGRVEAELARPGRLVRMEGKRFANSSIWNIQTHQIVVLINTFVREGNDHPLPKTATR